MTCTLTQKRFATLFKIFQTVGYNKRKHLSLHNGHGIVVSFGERNILESVAKLL